MTEQEVLDFVEENDVKFIRLAFVDLFGTLKNISIMPTQLHRALSGSVSFDASAVKGFCDISHSELFLRPDPKTITLLPWRPQTGRVARMMCDCLLPDGTLFTGYSRSILRQQVEKAKSLGLTSTSSTFSNPMTRGRLPCTRRTAPATWTCRRWTRARTSAGISA